MCLYVAAQERDYFEALIRDVSEWEMITDNLIRLDVSAVVDDETYFVFEDTLDELMLTFSRDTYVARVFFVFEV